MKLKIVSIFAYTFLVIFLLTACKKDSDKPATDTEKDEVSAAISDESQVTTEMDDIAVDASTAIEYEASFSGNNQVVDQIICDAVVEYSTSTNPMTITINYNGSICGNGRTRTGTIVLSMAQGTEWKTAGAHFTITFNDLKITKTATNKSISISGTHVVTNVSGGLLVNLPTEESIIHTVTSENMKIKFDNGTAREWNVAKQRAYTYNNGVVLSITGIHQDDQDATIAEWGTNRNGNSFKTVTIEPVVIKQSCNFRVTSGEVKHSTNAYAAVATFGLNAAGESIECPGTASYFYKLVWTGQGGASLSVILPY